MWCTCKLCGLLCKCLFQFSLFQFILSSYINISDKQTYSFSIEGFTILPDQEMKANIIPRPSFEVASDPFPQFLLVKLIPAAPHRQLHYVPGQAPIQVHYPIQPGRGDERQAGSGQSCSVSCPVVVASLIFNPKSFGQLAVQVTGLLRGQDPPGCHQAVVNSRLPNLKPVRLFLKLLHFVYHSHCLVDNNLQAVQQIFFRTAPHTYQNHNFAVKYAISYGQ